MTKEEALLYLDQFTDEEVMAIYEMLSEIRHTESPGEAHQVKDQP